jgi:cytochrome c-type biogenesis protein
MDFSLATFALAFAAGSLSTLSPCVLPIVPILLASAVAAHRMGPFALAAGLALSFTLIGVALASAGTVVGLDQALLRQVGAVLLIAFGVVLFSSRLQQRFAAAASGLSGAGNKLLARFPLHGLGGQFVLGLVLGVVWGPCVGPTLGGAISLASQGRDLGQVTLAMALFGIGAAAPLIALGLLSRQAIVHVRGKLLATGRAGKLVLAGVMLGLGALILTGGDKSFEAWMLNSAPDWLVRLTTAI